MYVELQAHIIGDPNRLSNLIAIDKDIHRKLITPEWNKWAASLGGRTPSAAEVMRKAIELDKKYGHQMY